MESVTQSSGWTLADFYLRFMDDDQMAQAAEPLRSWPILGWAHEQGEVFPVVIDEATSWPKIVRPDPSPRAWVRVLAPGEKVSPSEIKSHFEEVARVAAVESWDAAIRLLGQPEERRNPVPQQMIRTAEHFIGTPHGEDRNTYLRLLVDRAVELLKDLP